MALAAALIIGAYILTVVIVLAIPPRQRDPQYGMAIGCGMVLAFSFAAVELVLWAAWVHDVTWLVHAIFYLAAFTLVLIVPQGIRLAVVTMRDRRAKYERPLKPYEIADTLGGHTHVVAATTADPARDFRELFYYGPDGTLHVFRQEKDGRVHRLPGPRRSWAVDGVLLDHIDPEAGKRRFFLTRRRLDGRFSYFEFKGPPPQVGQLAFYTADVREGEPVEKDADPEPAADLPPGGGDDWTPTPEKA
jgi:hypothetical protein